MLEVCTLITFITSNTELISTKDDCLTRTTRHPTVCWNANVSHSCSWIGNQPLLNLPAPEYTFYWGSPSFIPNNDNISCNANILEVDNFLLCATCKNGRTTVCGDGTIKNHLYQRGWAWQSTLQTSDEVSTCTLAIRSCIRALRSSPPALACADASAYLARLCSRACSTSLGAEGAERKQQH